MSEYDSVARVGRPDKLRVRYYCETPREADEPFAIVVQFSGLANPGSKSAQTEWRESASLSLDEARQLIAGLQAAIARFEEGVGK